MTYAEILKYGFNMEEVLLDGLGYTELPPAVRYFPSAIPTISRYAKMMMARQQTRGIPLPQNKRNKGRVLIWYQSFYHQSRLNQPHVTHVS